MPSGAKKRKAAKRKKEQEQQQSPLGEDDLISQSSKRSDSGSESASPQAQGDREFRLELDREDEKGSDSAGPVDVVKVMGSIENSVEEHAIEPLTPEKTEAAMKKTLEAQDVGMVLGKELPQRFPSHPPSHTSTEIPTSEHESVTIDDRQSERSEDVNVGEEVPPPPPLEPKQSKSTYSADFPDEEVLRPTQLKERASWLSCCGLFDLISGASK
ncbi:unnamed protein product [Spirodela intermedia]|uniref:Uncharacterized protein n=1 Tax=Spirodela intermedia TaxID=51605 RepID=A0A7I8KIT5_SPIIN|nr:unnamed protein product [Spirodela intermedia]